jgi:hypothetical protein
VLLESDLSGKEPQDKHRGNHDAEKCYDGQQPNHLLVRTETDNGADPAAKDAFVRWLIF